jgi:hypothetical protein
MVILTYGFRLRACGYVSSPVASKYSYKVHRVQMYGVVDLLGDSCPRRGLPCSLAQYGSNPA